MAAALIIGQYHMERADRRAVRNAEVKIYIASIMVSLPPVMSAVRRDEPMPVRVVVEDAGEEGLEIKRGVKPELDGQTACEQALEASKAGQEINRS